MSFDQTAGTAHALLARASPKRRDGPEEEGPLLERHRRGGEARRWRHELLPGACPPGRVVRNVSPNPTHSTRFWHTPRDRGCRRVRHTSGIATPRDRTPTRVVLTTQKRAGSEEVPCAWLGCCAPERAVNAKVLPLAGARESPPQFLSETKRSDRDSVRSRRRPRRPVPERDLARTASGDEIPRAHGGSNERRDGRLTTVLPFPKPEWHGVLKKKNKNKTYL